MKMTYKDFIYGLLYSAGQMTTYTIWAAFGLALLHQTVSLPPENRIMVVIILSLGALGVGMYAQHQYRQVAKE